MPTLQELLFAEKVLNRVYQMLLPTLDRAQKIMIHDEMNILTKNIKKLESIHRPGETNI